MVKPPFTYSDQSAWSQLSGSQCGSTTGQSPVSIVTASVLQTPAMNLTTSTGASTLGRISWTYQSPTVNALLFTTARGWQAHLSDTTTVLEFFGKHYQLKRVEFTSPSENQLDGKSYDMEMQYVHEEAGTSNLLLSSVFLTAGNVENNAFLNSFWTQFPAQVGTSSKQAQMSNPYVAGLPTDRTLYAFNGSETIPPCKSGVIWTVFKEPIVISRQQRDAYRAALNASSLPTSNFLRFGAQPAGVATPWNIGLGMNNRLVQPHNTRKIMCLPMLNPPPAPSAGSPGSGQLWTYIGLGAAGVAVLVGILVMCCILCRRGSGDDSDEDSLLAQKPSRDGGWEGGNMAAPAGMRAASQTGYHQVPAGMFTQQQMQNMTLPQTQQLSHLGGGRAPMTQFNMNR